MPLELSQALEAIVIILVALLTIGATCYFLLSHVLPWLALHLVKRDWWPSIASVMLMVTIVVSAFSLIKAISLALVALATVDKDSGELWQAVAALGQVPLLAVASAALYTWAVQRNIGPKVKIGIYPTSIRRADIDIKKELPNLAKFAKVTSSDQIYEPGAKIVITNVGERALERPKIQITAFYTSLSSDDTEVSELPLTHIKVFGFHSAGGEGFDLERSDNDYIIFTNSETAMHPNEIWTISFQVTESGTTDEGYPTSNNFPFELGVLKVQMWGSNLEKTVDQYLVFAPEINHLTYEIANEFDKTIAFRRHSVTTRRVMRVLDKSSAPEDWDLHGI